MKSPSSYVPFAIGSGLIILAMIGLVSWQLAHPPTPLRARTATPVPTEAPRRAALFRPTETAAPTAAPAGRTLAPTARGGFAQSPRDLDVGGRGFTLQACEAALCYVRLDDGAAVWVSRADAGEPIATARPALAPAPPPPAPTVCAVVEVPGVRVVRCGYDLAALQAEAQQALAAELNPPTRTPDPAVLRAATIQAEQDLATAFAVQTAQVPR